MFTVVPDNLENRRRLSRVGKRRKDDVTNEVVLKLVPFRWVQVRFEEATLADNSRGSLVYRAPALADVTIYVQMQPSAFREVGSTKHIKFIGTSVIRSFRGEIISRRPQSRLWRWNRPRDTTYEQAETHQK